MNHLSQLLLSVFFIYSLGLTALDLNKDQSIIEDVAPEKNNAKKTYAKEKDADQTPADTQMLFQIPGLTVTDHGGAMASADLSYRGLSNGRFLTNIDGLLLNNPMTGAIDANSMFLFAAKYLQTNAQSLSILLPTITEPMAKGIFGYGSQNTMKAGAAAGTPFGKSSIFVAAQYGQSDGKFYFQSPDDPEKNNILRENNDQQRIQALVKYERKGTSIDSHALLAVNFHKSGIPGFAFSPTKNLRSSSAYAGLSMGMLARVNGVDIKLDSTNSLFNYNTTDIPKREEQFLSSSHEIYLGMKASKLPKNMDFEMGPKIIIERAYELDKTRVGGGLFMKRSMIWSGKLKPSTSATFGMVGYQGHGLVFQKDLSFSIEPTNYLGLTGRFMRQQRLPTFMELYANNNFFVGNENLSKESIMDIELATNIRAGDHTRIAITGFLGFLSDTIVNVPFKINQTRPTNVKTVRRYGIDTFVVYEPTNWFMFESKNSLLKTKNSELDAPLPHAPLFSGLSKARFGKEDFISLTMQMRYRTSATSDIYGSIWTKPYVLCDSILSAKVMDHLGLSLSVSNIFNVKTARDTYEMPISGTVFFAQIEVGSI